MFFGMSVDTGLISSEGRYINSQPLSTVTVLSNAQVIGINLFSPGILQSVGNFQIKLNPYFSPSRFSYFFGANAVQDLSKIVIKKSDLFGLRPLPNNTAESLLAGIITTLLSGQKGVNFPSISLDYWGYGYTDGKKIDTVIINLFNLAAYDGNILLDSNYSLNVNPNQY